MSPICYKLYFGPARDSAPPGNILQLVRAVGLQPYVGEPTISRTDFVAQRLAQTRDRIVRDILLEEWTFLIGHSWIAARRKKAFDAFKWAGAVVVDFSGQKFDAVVARTLHHHRLPLPPSLSHRDRVRAAAKWTAAGGSSVSNLVDPAFATLVGAITAVFFLFDP